MALSQKTIAETFRSNTTESGKWQFTHLFKKREWEWRFELHLKTLLQYFYSALTVTGNRKLIKELTGKLHFCMFCMNFISLCTLQSAKYLPDTPSTSSETAR